MPDDRYEVTFSVTVEVVVHDRDAISRVVENHDDQHNPQPRQQGGWGWRDHFYDLDEAGAAEMLAYNLGVQHRRLASLDGWADLPDEAVELINTDVQLDTVVKNGTLL